MRIRVFAGRTAKEILRDPLNLGFGLGFPVVLMLLMTAIQRNVPVEIFAIESLTPGVMVFSLSFLTLFSATLIARDRESAFLRRLYTTPMRAADFIFGYALPLLPMGLAQGAVTLAVGAALGLEISIKMLWTLALHLPMTVFFIALGLLCGSVLNGKQVGGLCGALLTNVTAWLSGAWFDIKLVGGAFESVANALPFVHAVEMERAVLAGNHAEIASGLLWTCAYAAVTLSLAVFTFLKSMRKK